MFAGTQQQRLHQQPEEQGQLKQPQLSAEEEALKRNTDCVYFLASPLTCKKGSECEYRHSEYARLNPRDCYYWLNGNCLNPKCGFRHPPLDGLLGTQVTAPPGPSAVPAATNPPYGSSAPSSSGKPAVPCIFYQKGYCLKGDRCAFLHGPVPTANPIPRTPALKKTFGAFEKCTTQQQNTPSANVAKTVEVPHEPKAPPKVEVPRYRAPNIPRAVNAKLSHQALEKPGEQHLRESSPGFDVLVDNELGRNGNEYDTGCSDDSYDCGQGQYDRDQQRSPDPIGETDLRFRLSKQRRVNGLRSVVARDHASEDHVQEERSHPDHSSQRKSSISSRLRGRINLPQRYPVNDMDDDARLGREMERGQTALPGRLKDRIKGRAEEEDGNSKGDPRIRRENFTGPIRLSELKASKDINNKEHDALRKRKAQQQQSEGVLSFEGPMPLSEILKRKREARTEEKTEVTHNEPPQLPTVSDHDVEDGMIEDENVQDHEVEDGKEEYYYEQGDEGDYNYEEDAENLEPGEEYIEDEDGDDFAKKIGVAMS